MFGKTKIAKIVWALVLGLMLTSLGTAGAATNLYTSDDTTQENWERTDFVKVGLMVRWGYLDGLPHDSLRGVWTYSEDGRDRGPFHGVWMLEGRIGGYLQGVWESSGQKGIFVGEWNYSDGSDGGYLRGIWIKVGERGGFFKGKWNYTDGTHGGFLAGRWGYFEEREGGPFGGYWIKAESIEMVPWDGFIQVTRGAVVLIKPLLFERGGEYEQGGDDLIYPRNNRFTLEWRSSTTVHWDGVVVVLILPKIREPMPHVTINTEQWSRVYEAKELIGIHERIAIDDLGHEIEIIGRLVEGERSGFAKIGLMVRWGFLGEREDEQLIRVEVEKEEGLEESFNEAPMVPWDGFISVTRGAVVLKRTLLFERGGNYEYGSDDVTYERNNRFTLEWRSSTTTHWDGVLVVLYVPLTRPEVHATIHTDQWSNIYEASDLIGLHERIKTDDQGHEIEIVGKLLEIKWDEEPIDLSSIEPGGR